MTDVAERPVLPQMGVDGLATRIRALGGWSRVTYVGAAIVLLYAIVALTAPLWIPYSPTKLATGPPFAGVSWRHLMGTDYLGRDVFSRVVYGTRIDLLLAVAGTGIAEVVGATLGFVAAQSSVLVDEVVMRLAEGLISIPFIMLALVLVSAAGPDVTGSYVLLICVVVAVYAPRMSRIARSAAKEIGNREFVTLARLRGERGFSLALREILPNAVPIMLVDFTIRLGNAPVLIGGLGFLGFGVQPPNPEWGLMISENRAALQTSPISVLGPACALAGLVIGVNLLGEGIGRRLGHSSARSES